MAHNKDNELLQIALTQYSFILPVNMHKEITGCEFAKKILKHFESPEAYEISKICMRRLKTIRRHKGSVRGVILQ